MEKEIKLMLVDDDEIFVFLTKRIIGETNLVNQVKVFGNGRDAIEYMESAAGNPEMLPEVILLDLSMPIMDGWGFIDRYIMLKPRLGKTITLCILSSSVSPHDLDKAKAYSVVSDYIVKPVEKDKFLNIIKNL
jgi:CheY-like chemotaxis protein